MERPALRDGNLTATVLFTDLVGSTALRASLGEDLADQLRRAHDELLTTAVVANGGTVIKGGGDGVMALFVAATDALTAAAHCQQAVWRYNRRPDRLAELSVRIGLSVGDVAVEGGDCFGTPVIEAARLEAAASGGQVLCSELVRLMTRGRGGHQLLELGPMELKGLPEPVVAYDLLWERPSEAADGGSIPFPRELAAEAGRPFVGREGEVDAGLALIGRPATARLAVIWVAGEPGIGKTRLAAEIASRAFRDGAAVLFGRCAEDLAVPYQPFAEALASYVGTVADQELPARLGPRGSMLSRLLPDLTQRAPELTAPPTITADTDRYDLYEAMRGWLSTLAEDRRVVLVVDDVHWATAATLQLLGHLGRSAEPLAVTLLCTARNTAPDDTEELRRTRAELERRADFTELTLSGLDVAAVTELVGNPSEAARLVADTAGNPLFVDARRRGGSVASLAQSRVGRLEPKVQELLAVAAVAGLEFELSVVAAAGSVGALDALDALETAAGAGLVEELAADRFAFSHALVRAALRDSLSRSRQARLHLAIATALRTRATHDLSAAASVAHHSLEAGELVPAALAAADFASAGDGAAGQFAFGAAAGWYREALRREPDEQRRPRLRFQLGQAVLRTNDFSGALVELEAACRDALGVGAHEVAVDAAMLFEEASWRPGFPGHAALALIDLVLSALQLVTGPGVPGWVAVLLGARARALQLSGRRTESMEVARAAIASDPRATTAYQRSQLLNRCGYIFLTNPPRPELAGIVAELDQLAGQTNDLGPQLEATNFAINLALIGGDPVETQAILARMLTLTERIRDVFWVHVAISARFGELFDQARLDEAEALAEQASQRDPDEDDSWSEPEGLYGVRMFQIRREQARLDEVAPGLTMLARLSEGRGIWRVGLGLLLVELDRLDDARTQFDSIATDRFAAIPEDDNRLLHLCFAAEICAAVGGTAEARLLEAELAAVGGLYIMLAGSGIRLGPGDRYLGLLRLVQGDMASAAELLRSAAALARRMGSPLWEARSLADLAIGCGDHEGQRRAVELASRHSLPAIARRANRGG